MIHEYMNILSLTVLLMPSLSYPFVYECSNYEKETTVTREDARGLYPHPDSMNAVEIVLQQRGWLRDHVDGLLWCPDCTVGNESN